MAKGFNGGHSEAYRIAALTLYDEPVEVKPPLAIVGGEVNWNKFTAVSTGGSVTVNQTGLDWLDHRVAISYLAKKRGYDDIEKQLVIGIVTGVEPNDREGVETLTFSDKCLILVEDQITESMSFAKGHSVVGAISQVIEGAVGIGVNVIASLTDDTLDSAMSWPVGTSKIVIVNKLAEAINFQKIRVNGDGAFLIQPKATSEVVHEFSPGPESIVSDEVEDSRDLFGIPNQLQCLGTSDGETEAMSATAQNNDPDSRYSIDNRGRVISRTDEDVEASSQAVLQAIAESRLVEASMVTWRQTIRHLWLDLELDQDVIGPSGQQANIVEMSQNLVAGSLTTTVIRRMGTIYGGGYDAG